MCYPYYDVKDLCIQDSFLLEDQILNTDKSNQDFYFKCIDD
jgi:hypothetical protein